MLEILGSLFPAAVLAGTPLLLGALGEILTERAGNLNLGVEGMMFMAPSPDWLAPISMSRQCSPPAGLPAA